VFPLFCPLPLYLCTACSGHTQTMFAITIIGTSCLILFKDIFFLTARILWDIIHKIHSVDRKLCFLMLDDWQGTFFFCLMHVHVGKTVCNQYMKRGCNFTCCRQENGWSVPKSMMPRKVFGPKVTSDWRSNIIWVLKFLI
jgi:hypothetical protein